MKGIVMLTANYHPYVGGAEGQARTVAAELARRGIPVRVVTRRLPGLKSREKIDGILVERLPAWGPGALGALVFAAACFFNFLRRVSDYDVIHVHLASSPAVAAALAGRLAGKRVVVKLGGGVGVGEIALSKGTLLGGLKLKALGLLGPVLVAVNSDMLGEIAGSGLEGLKTCVIPNGVDLKNFYPAEAQEKSALRRQLGWPAGFALLSTSRLTQDKRTGDLLREFLEVWAAADNGGARLYIAGSGPEQEPLKAYARKLGAEASVEFLGSRDDLGRLYRAADAFLLPTSSEGVSNSLLEAMACGLAALATRVSGTTQIVRDGENGLLYSPGDRAELRGRLERLIREPELADRLGKAARGCAEGFSLEKTADLWLEIYRQGCVCRS